MLVISVLLLVLPTLLYSYFLIRGNQLALNDMVLAGWPRPVAQGIVSPHYENSPTGFFNFVTGRPFFGYVTGYWAWKWETLIADWIALLLEAVNLPVLLFVLIGMIRMSMRRLKLTFWLIANALMFQLLALQYRYAGLQSIGQFSTYSREYYLPSFICLVIFAAWGIDGFMNWMRMNLSRVNLPEVLASTIPSLLAGLLLIVTLRDVAARHSTDLTERSSEIRAKWDGIRKFPPEKNAALVAHWGDLTPLWYLQNAEGWRNDLITIYPPDEERVNTWMATGKPLYLAGSTLGWAPEILVDRHLTPWGSLVSVTDNRFIPSLPLSHSGNWTFQEDRPIIRLLGY
jgi:hypothetical protein